MVRHDREVKGVGEKGVTRRRAEGSREVSMTDLDKSKLQRRKSSHESEQIKRKQNIAVFIKA